MAKSEPFYATLQNYTAVAGGVASLDATGNVPANQLANAGAAPTSANIPFNVQSAAYTTTLTDAGLCIFHPSTDNTQRIWTIAASSSVAYLIGTAITFLNRASTITIVTPVIGDTLFLVGSTTTGTRFLSTTGMATAVKATSSTWVINGNGLT